MCVVDRLGRVVNEALRPILNGIREDIESVKQSIANLTDRVNQMAEDIMEHKENTASAIADLQQHNSSTVLNKVEALNSKINLIHTRMKNYFHSMESKVGIMINDELLTVDNKMNAMSDLVRADLDDVKTELSSVSSTTQELCDKIKEHEINTTAKLIKMKKKINHRFSELEESNSLNTGGWRRVVFLNMTNPTTNCPPGWQLTSYSKRSCGRVNTSRLSCDSVFFPVSGGPYNQVMGRIRAYQWGNQHAFAGRYDQKTVDGAYFSGVAVMHGSPREHIWTFAAGNRENETRTYYNCPCDNPAKRKSVPDFVGDDYFCESGAIWPGYYSSAEAHRLFHEDPLWDGKGCHHTSSCCSFNNPPYFLKTLTRPTTDSLELKMCHFTYSAYSDTAVELIELYVKQDFTQTKLIEMEDQLKNSISRQTENINNLHVHTCGGTGGWRRAVYFDMTNPSTECPSGWMMTGHSKRTCSRSRSIEWTCDSTFTPVSGGPYNQVCGRIKAYQFGLPNAFYGHYRYGLSAIDNAYFDGVAVMHGIPRHHIWTFAAGAWENAWQIEPRSWYNCPCDGHNGRYPPSFVGNDYFCESAYIHPGYRNRSLEQQLHYNDMLWDGKDCLSTSTCCSLNRPPYFTKNLTETTSDDIELRICDFEQENNIAVEMVEIYVKLEPELVNQNEVIKLPPHPVYIDSSLHMHTCGGTGGWRRAVYLDMTDPNTDCPAGWKLTPYEKRTCHSLSDGQGSCNSAFFPVEGGPYRQICGRIKAYQWNRPAAFTLSYTTNTPDDPYFDGVAVMHGQRPRHHIWTFAAGYPENRTDTGGSRYSSICPCDPGSYAQPPPFVGDDYFCESGYVWPGYYDSIEIAQLHYNDTLWDGDDCHYSSTCCSLHNPPYFTKTLSEITNDDLEVRSCTYGSPVAIELVELYVKP